MSEDKTICMENHSRDGEVLRQELVNYRKVGRNLVKERVKRVFFGDGECFDSFTGAPLTKENI